jgi:hypothetical protein
MRRTNNPQKGFSLKKQLGLTLVQVLLPLLCVALLVGVLWLMGAEQKIALTAAEIKTALNTQFPLTKTHLKLLEVTYFNPVVILEDGSDRIKLGLSAETMNPLTKKDLNGSVIVSAKIVYSSNEGAFYLHDIRVESVHIEGLPDKWTTVIADTGARGIAEYLNQYPVYKLNSENFKHNTARYLLKDIEIKNQRLILTLKLGK